MILLDYHNKIIEDTIVQRVDQYVADKEGLPVLEIIAADFDGAVFHISSDANSKNLVKISLQWRCAQDLLKNGGSDILKAEYGALLQGSPEAGYDATLVIDLEQPKEKVVAVAKQAALLKRHTLAGPFRKVFDAVDKGTNLNPIWIQYRNDEGFLVKAEGDRAIVVYEIHFSDAADQVLAKVFLQEFADARRSMNNVPAVTFTQKDPPMELKGVKGVKADASQGFVSFVLFKNHLDAKNRDKTINNIQTFRNYLHYHIKCSKAYMHERMRKRVDTLLQILNRAKVEPLEPKEKKTITGKTFKPAAGAAGKAPATKGGPGPSTPPRPK
jgi:actin related protein 2/3 complex subunit 2